MYRELGLLPIHLQVYRSSAAQEAKKGAEEEVEVAAGADSAASDSAKSDLAELAATVEGSTPPTVLHCSVVTDDCTKACDTFFDVVRTSFVF